MLDGLENNNYLITGPLTQISPDLIQEYRVSVNNFSAEYGRTAGFVANAITYSGTETFHGVGYLYFKNDVLNANDFQRNLRGAHRVPIKEVQPGVRVGGPILRNRLLFSSAFEQLRDRSRLDSANYLFPTPAYIANLPAQSLAKQLLTNYAPPVVPASTRNFSALPISPPSSINRSTALERLDYRAARDQVSFTGSMVLVSRPDFLWNPYAAFSSGLHQNTLASTLSDVHTFNPGLVNEARMGYSNDDLSYGRANPQIPTLVSSDGSKLPGAGFIFPYRNRNGTWQFLDNVVRTRGRHLMTAGVGLLLRSSNGTFAPGRDGEFFFSDLNAFAQDKPNIFEATVNRASLPTLQQPNFQREYRYKQYFLFFEDTFKVTPRLTLNYGLRYENYGSPTNVGAVKDALVQLGPGNNWAQELAGAQFVYSGSGNEKLFQTDQRDLAPRIGFAFDIFGGGRTLLRGASGIFYDRPFDNLWQELRVNNASLSIFRLTASSTNYLAGPATLLPPLASLYSPTTPPSVSMVENELKNARITSSFLGVEHQVLRNLSLEVNGLMTLGRRLITTDVINRFGGVYSSPLTRTVPSNIFYRGSQGSSNYDALTAVVRYRISSAQFQAAYTWSHSIDNQSDALRHDLLDFGFTSGTSTSTGAATGTGFSHQFDSGSDRGSSDFDQRQNFVYFGTWNLPAPRARTAWSYALRDWTLSGLGAFRSGFPYSVYALFGRANITNPARTQLASPTLINGGKLLLDKTGFGTPLFIGFGNSGRNVFLGPGFYNLDLSLSRRFAAPWLGESGRVVLRGDAYNFLNHANLNNPSPNLALSDFGQAMFGRSGVQSGFPSIAPLNETARNLQLGIRIEF
jgi:hypothetical protein